jgi:hypothetical protein
VVGWHIHNHLGDPHARVIEREERISVALLGGAEATLILQKGHMSTGGAS